MIMFLSFFFEFEILQVWSCNSTWLRGLKCLFAWLVQQGLRKSWNAAARVSSDGPFLLFAAFYLRVAHQLREPNFSPSSSLLLLASYNVCSIFALPSSSFSSHPFLFLLSNFRKERSGRERRPGSHGGFAEGPQWALCPSPKHYLPQPSLGSLETKPVLIPQMNLHSSLYC